MAANINYHRRQLISEVVVMDCMNCNKFYPQEAVFCPLCGEKLLAKKSKLYANFGKHGITSYSYKLPNGVTLNSKCKITLPLGNGLSYTIK